MAREDLKYLFYPNNVAVIGASRTPGKIGYELLRNILEYGYKGKVYPINPKAEEILGLKSYPSVLNVPDKVDMAVIAVPAKVVPKVLEECGRKGVKAAIVISSGFKEVGNVALEEKIVSIAKKYGIRLLGPNIFGLYYAPSKLNATFGPRDVLPGSIAFISQSGALGIALMGWTILEEIGLSAVVSIGNKADIDDADLIEFFLNDEHTKVILIYMEGIRRAREFMKVARVTTKNKPIIVIKAGRSEKGVKAIVSHTGSLAGSDTIYSAAFKQCGVLRAMNIEEAFDWARALAQLPSELKREEAIIITNGGGLGVMATDACQEYGIKLLEVPEDLIAEFRKYMPPFGSPYNPVDLTGQATEKEYYGAVSTALSDERIGMVIVLYCETAVADPIKVAEVVVKAKEEAKEVKPIIAAMIGGERTEKAIKELNRKGVPAYPVAERAISSLSAFKKWIQWRQRM